MPRIVVPTSSRRWRVPLLNSSRVARELLAHASLGGLLRELQRLEPRGEFAHHGFARLAGDVARLLAPAAPEEDAEQHDAHSEQHDPERDTGFDRRQRSGAVEDRSHARREAHAFNSITHLCSPHPTPRHQTSVGTRLGWFEHRQGL